MARHRRNPDRARTARASLAPLGLAAAATLGATPLAMASPAAPHGSPESSDTPPCEDGADVCVDLSDHKAWLTDDGRATTPAMPITSGSAEDPTPTGTFSVQRKDRHHVSKEIGNAPMPYSVFFDDEGRAIHSGETAGTSHGCIHLDTHDARAVFGALDPGDEVEIVR